MEHINNPDRRDIRKQQIVVKSHPVIQKTYLVPCNSMGWERRHGWPAIIN